MEQKPKECHTHENKIRRFDYWEFLGQNDEEIESWRKSQSPQRIQTFCADCGKLLKQVKIIWNENLEIK